MSLKEDISKKYKKMRWLKKKYGLEYPTVWKDELKKAREEKDYKKISEVLDDMIMDLEIQKEEKLERKQVKNNGRRNPSLFKKGFEGWMKFLDAAADKWQGWMKEEHMYKGGTQGNRKKSKSISLSAIEKRFESNVPLMANKVMVMLRRDDAQDRSERLGELVLSSDLPTEKKEAWFEGQELAKEKGDMK
ncbi:MAG: hypothetical protein KGY68_09295 [Candidatus Thermoplasmatota archaeon]|nr:hypothetical protein [Candidatus Thermoplasmatota archaeon]